MRSPGYRLSETEPRKKRRTCRIVTLALHDVARKIVSAKRVASSKLLAIPLVTRLHGAGLEVGELMVAVQIAMMAKPRITLAERLYSLFVSLES